MAITEISMTVLNKDGIEVPLNVIPINRVAGTIEASSSLEPVKLLRLLAFKEIEEVCATQNCSIK